ncbi:MAG TPA: YbaK/EbsC family protein [Bacteroidota bacterium]
MTILESITQFLQKQGIPFSTVHHEETRTSEESARARGEDISIGGKALLVKIDDAFRLFVISASQRVDSKKIKVHFGAKSIRFANEEELRRLTGLIPGAVPPFGRPIQDLDLFVDESITRNTKIAFNAGSLTDSIIMQTEDYLRAAKPTVLSFSQQQK